jgi:hypothetical protein
MEPRVPFWPASRGKRVSRLSFRESLRDSGAASAATAPAGRGKPWLTTREASDYCGFETPGALRRAARRHRIAPADRPGGCGSWMWRREDLDALVGHRASARLATGRAAAVPTGGGCRRTTGGTVVEEPPDRERTAPAQGVAANEQGARRSLVSARKKLRTPSCIRDGDSSRVRGGGTQADQEPDTALPHPVGVGRSPPALVHPERVVSALRDDASGRLDASVPFHARTRVTRDAILRDVAMMERLARRLRRFMMGLAEGTVEVDPEPRPPPIDDPTRALARRLLARSGFVKVKP